MRGGSSDAASRETSAGNFRLVSGQMRVDCDYYQLLGVRREATQDELEYAYRRYVIRIHPDKYFLDPDRRRTSEEKLKAINMAMQILRDPALRARYDTAWRWA